MPPAGPRSLHLARSVEVLLGDGEDAAGVAVVSSRGEEGAPQVRRLSGADLHAAAARVIRRSGGGDHRILEVVSVAPGLEAAAAARAPAVEHHRRPQADVLPRIEDHPSARFLRREEAPGPSPRVDGREHLERCARAQPHHAGPAAALLEAAPGGGDRASRHEASGGARDEGSGGLEPSAEEDLVKGDRGAAGAERHLAAEEALRPGPSDQARPRARLDRDLLARLDGDEAAAPQLARGRGFEDRSRTEQNRSFGLHVDPAAVGAVAAQGAGDLQRAGVPCAGPKDECGHARASLDAALPRLPRAPPRQEGRRVHVAQGA
jgi:hypothetical protein